MIFTVACTQEFRRRTRDDWKRFQIIFTPHVVFFGNVIPSDAKSIIKRFCAELSSKIAIVLVLQRHVYDKPVTVYGGMTKLCLALAESRETFTQHALAFPHFFLGESQSATGPHSEEIKNNNTNLN